MTILHTVKYFYPSKGGMESVVRDIVEGVQAKHPEAQLTVYANSHVATRKRVVEPCFGARLIREKTPFVFKSQPSNIYYPRLKQLIRGHDVVHHHFPFPNMEASLLASSNLLREKNFVITWHANIGMTRWKWAGSVYFPFVRKLLNIARTIVVTSPQLLEHADLLHAHEKKVKIVPLSFSPFFENKITGKCLPASGPARLLFVGKLRKYKGLPVLIAAVKDLAVEVDLIGDGEEEEALLSLIRDSGQQEKIRIHKNLDNEALLNFYRNAHLFVLPSLHEAEAFGVVQLEAMANAMPVINTQLNSGVPFVSLNGETGFTVPPGDVDKLKQAIQSIISDPELYKTFSQNSYRRSQLFTREKMAEAYWEIYNS